MMRPGRPNPMIASVLVSPPRIDPSPPGWSDFPHDHAAWSRPAAGMSRIEHAIGTEIQVKGTLSPTLLAALEGFEVSSVERGRTTLVGWVSDQARLFSTLEVLRDLNIELVSLNPGPDQPVVTP